MRVMLVSLPGILERDGCLFPLGIGYLAAALNGEHQVESYHYSQMKLARQDLPERVRAFRPEVVGLTCSTFNRGFVKEVIALLRSMGLDLTIVVGGVHASFCYQQMISRYDADVVVIGEGEITMAELCRALEQRLHLGAVAGIAYRQQDAVVLNPPRQTVSDLDSLPVPDYSYARAFIESCGMAFMITSRGCPVRCTFCSTSSFWGQQVRMNSVQRVVDEMELLVSQFQVKRIFFHDDTFNLGIARVKAICSEIRKRGLEVEWACSCRVSPVSQEMIEAMVEAGCRHICWGVESGSQQMLEQMDKKISLAQIANAFELSSKFSDRMSTGAFTMVGNPGESEATIRQTVEFLNSVAITDAPSTSVLYVLPGTVLCEDLKRAGHVSDSDWYLHDTVPYYTVENSYRALSDWAARVSASGDRIPFDQSRHFWGGLLDAAPENATAARQSLVLRGGQLLGRRTKALLDAWKDRQTGKIRY